MKYNKIAASLLISMAFANFPLHAGTMGSVMNDPGKMYLGVFGGAGASDNVDIKMLGTVFFVEATGGPLAVNAFGKTNSGTVGFVGGQVGYRWAPINLFNSVSAIAAATELEGYYLGKSTFSGHLLNNNERLAERDFVTSFPVRTGVFLVNAVANLNLDSQPRFHPYVGAGIGAGVLSIKNAVSNAISPIEPGINHFNSNSNSSDAAFAAQVKVGLSTQLTSHIDIFGEYRWLYLSSSDHNFGSTVDQTHAVTSSWLVQLGSQNYNLGSVGLRYSI